MFRELIRIPFYRWLLAAMSLLSSAVAASAATNSLTITEKAGRTTSNYPMQIGRPFVQGEIPDFPQALLNGTVVTTQADVKTRWPDGSVKHAILTFLVPTLNANSSVTVTFRNQTSGNNSGYLTLTQMLGAAFDFDAVMTLTNGTSRTASARSVLSASAFTYWLQGPVATSIVLADHGAGRVFDIGFDGYRSFRPVFHATFWPGINKVRVRFIGEIANSEAFQDQVYSLALRLGLANPTQVYSKASFTHCAGQRWTKEFWIGGAPSAIAVNDNLAYLSRTMLLPNWDATKVIPEGTLAAEYAYWNGASKDVGDGGNWQKSMGVAGGREDIGPLPTWSIRWLYSGDSRMREMAFGNADLAAAWPMHFREGKSTKYFDAAKTTLGLGKVISTRDRPSILIFPGHITDYRWGLNGTNDRIVLVGTYTDNGWAPDAEHWPEPFFPQYLLSGDFWYLEEMYFWSSCIAAYQHPVGRGPTGTEGGMAGDATREKAWSLRNRYYAAVMAPDGTAEKAYFTALTNELIASWEGTISITTTAFYGNAMWKFGRTGYLGARLDAAGGVPPLHQWDQGSAIFAAAGYGIDTSKVSTATSAFGDAYLLTALGIGKRLGVPTDALFSRLAQMFIGMLTHPGVFDPYHIGTGRFPVAGLHSVYFTTWAQAEAGFLPVFTNGDEGTVTTLGNFNWQMQVAENGYAFLALAGLSMATGEPNGATAWAWMVANVASDPYSVLNANPKWCLVPDGALSAPRGVRIRH